MAGTSKIIQHFMLNKAQTVLGGAGTHQGKPAIAQKCRGESTATDTYI